MFFTGNTFERGFYTKFNRVSKRLKVVFLIKHSITFTIIVFITDNIISISVIMTRKRWPKNQTDLKLYSWSIVSLGNIYVVFHTADVDGKAKKTSLYR